MKRRLSTLLLCAVMLFGVTAGCAGGTDSQSPAPEATAAPASEPAAQDAAAPGGDAPGAAAPDAAAPGGGAPGGAAPGGGAPGGGAPGGGAPESSTLDFSAQPVVSLPIENDGHVYSVWIGGLNMDAPINEWDDNYAIKEWMSRTGVSMSFDEIAPPTMSERFNLMIASQEYPDVLSEATSLYSGGGSAMVTEEIIIDLAPYLEEYAPSYSWLRANDPEFAADTVNNDGTITEFYGYAYNTLGASSGALIRGDWLEQLGAEVPSTYDEFHELLVSIKAEGLCDSPLAVMYSGTMGGAFLEGGFGLPAVSSNGGVADWGVMNGELTYIPTSDEFKEYLITLRDWYAEGLVYPDLLSSPMHESSTILNGNYGVFCEVGEFISNYESQAQDPNFSLVPVPNLLKSEDSAPVEAGVMPRARQASAWTISTTCPNPGVIISAIDYLFSVEGGYLGSYGIEGTTWEYSEDGKPVFTEFATNNPDGWTYTAVTQVYCISIPGILGDQGKYNQTYTQTQIDAASIWLENVTESENDNRGLWSMSEEENTEFANVYADISTYVSETVPQMFTGAVNLEDTWDEYCATIESMDVARCTEIVAAARDRYNSRTTGN